MKVLMISQPLYNRGDESAHKGLLRHLVRTYNDIEITVIWVGGNQDCINQFDVNKPNVKYVNLPKSKLYFRLGHFMARTESYWICRFFPIFRNLLKYYKDSDIILCAPGGINLGGFQSWMHVFYLNLAKCLNKPLYYYGRSIGPFPEVTLDNKRFKKAAINILRYMSFISLRDNKSETEALNLGITNAIKTLDSAFLDSPKVNIPSEIQTIIGSNPYMVFVPNILIWHFAYRNRISLETVHRFYCKLIDCIKKCMPDCNIVMLPQTFNYKNKLRDDIHLFNDLASLKNDERIIVIPDRYSSDIQQTIIGGARCLIGARYHSVVFSINQAIPFIALSYEHKISGLLETLGKTDCMIDITSALDSDQNIQQTLDKVTSMLQIIKADENARTLAKNIAQKSFDKFCNTIK